MGMIKTIIIAMVVAFIIAAMLIWFPDQTLEILKLIYQAGIKLGILLWSVIKRIVSAILIWIYANK